MVTFQTNSFFFLQILYVAITCEPIDSSGDIIYVRNRTVGIMVNVLVLTAVGIGFEQRSSQMIDYTIGICCFSVRHSTLTRNIGWLGIIIMYSSGAMSTRGLLFQWDSSIKFQLSVFVYYKVDIMLWYCCVHFLKGKSSCSHCCCW